MSIQTIIEETANALKTNADELDYISEDLIIDYFLNSLDEDVSESDAEGEKTANRWGVYANSLTYSTNHVHYKRGRKGTPNYGCGNDSYRVGKNNARYIIEQGTCSGGKKWYFIGNYRP
ncbi:hypothetical protein [Nitrincola lacisaponensis]|uniref:hypothetical protein n=1 Tax=Nitrincola lacisaponensis TaxID=267850 RepID=UPI00055F328B|nr:hypothetical protein [Nitrincola lacisaponensis]